MPRSNRSRRSRATRDEPEIDIERALTGHRHTETKRGRAWNVQPIAAASATKTYLCPGCSLEIAPGTAHTVAWRADGLFGEEQDIAGRRHWHNHCWTVSR